MTKRNSSTRVSNVTSKRWESTASSPSLTPRPTTPTWLQRSTTCRHSTTATAAMVSSRCFKRWKSIANSIRKTRNSTDHNWL